MKVHLILAIAVLVLTPTLVVAVDGLPPVQLPENGDGPSPGMTPERPSKFDEPEIPLSRMDGGIQHMQEARLDPHASMAPPNLDPSMSVSTERLLRP